MAQTDRDEDGFYTGEGVTTILLRTPVKQPGTAGDLTSVTLQEPNAKQLSAFFQRANTHNDDGVIAMTNLIADCSGVAPNIVETFKQRDHDKCAAWLQLFTKALPKPPAA